MIIIMVLTSCASTQYIDNEDLPIDFANLNKNLINDKSRTTEDFEVKYDTNKTFKSPNYFSDYADRPSFTGEVVLYESNFYEFWFLDPILKLKKNQQTTLLMYR